MSGATEFPYPDDDPASIRSMVTALDGMAGGVAGAAETVRGGRGSLEVHWVSPAGWRAVVEADAIAGLGGSAATALAEAGPILEAYAQELDTARGDIDHVRSRYDALQVELGPGPPSSPGPQPADPATTDSRLSGLRAQYGDILVRLTATATAVGAALTEIAGRISPAPASRNADVVRATVLDTLPFMAPHTGTTVIRTGNNVIVDTGNGDDDVRVTRDPETGEMTVSVNGEVLRFSAEEAGDVVIRTNGGSDVIEVSPGIQVGLTLLGGRDADLIAGGAGTDVMDGGAGDDDLVGGLGNDTLAGGTGDDDIGDGLDLVAATGLATKYGGRSVAHRDGGGDDVVAAGRGHDAVDSGAGHDVVFAGHGNDRVWAGAGWDEVYGESGDDVLTGVDGNDRLHGGEGTDVLDGGAGDDGLWGDAGGDTLIGGEGDDAIFGDDWLAGGDGNDVVMAGDGDDRVQAGGGNDLVYAGQGNDVVYGEGGKDALFGEDGDDFLSGNEGDDLIVAGVGDDEALGGDGKDRLLGGTGDDRLEGGRDDDVILAGEGHDDVDAGGGNDYVDAFTGDDVVHAGAGDDIVYAGEGNDFVDGAGGKDYLDGYAGDDQMFGGSGADVVSGGSGQDLLAGEGGDDVIYTGADRDEVVDRSGDNAIYHQGEDHLDVNDGDKRVTVEVMGIPPNIRIEGSPEFVARARADLETLAASPVGQQMLAQLGQEGITPWATGDSLTIRENTDPSVLGLAVSDEGNDVVVSYSATTHITVLQHELAHAYNFMSDTMIGSDGGAEYYLGPDRRDSAPDVDADQDGRVSFEEVDRDGDGDIDDHDLDRDGDGEVTDDDGWTPNSERQAEGLPVDHDHNPDTPDVPASQVVDHPEELSANALRREMGLPPSEEY